MKRRVRHTAALLASLAMILPVAATACPPRRGGFKVYQALLYDQMPDLRARGIARLHVVDRGFWRDGNGPGSVADPARVAAVVADLPRDGAPIAIDIEWPGLHVRDAATAGQIGALAGIAAQFKAAGGHPVGYYGVFPLSDYWRAIDVPAGGVAEWQRDNDGAAAINRHVDVTFPSLYTYYHDRAGWVRQANALVCEARRISGGKPVYAFVWPEYHVSAPDAGQDLAPDYWQLQLETLYRLADGVVLWGGVDLQANHRRQWNERAPWWRVTQALMTKWGMAHRLPAAVPPATRPAAP